MRKINYKGSSKLIKAICDTLDEIIDGGIGSNVSITPSLSSGTKIADFEIDGDDGALYAPTPPTVHNPPSGGAAGQVLTKNSAMSYDYSWNTPQSGGSDVSITPTISSGTKIAEYEIDGVNGKLYAPEVHNVPSGGSTNQVLAKRSSTDYDLKWVNQSGGGGGGGESPLYYDSEGYLCIDYSLIEER